MILISFASLGIGIFIIQAARVILLDLGDESQDNQPALGAVEPVETPLAPVTKKFKGGDSSRFRLGITYTDANGLIKAVKDSAGKHKQCTFGTARLCQARDEGVQVGWKILKVGKKEYTRKRLDDSLKKTEFELTFQTWTYQKLDDCSAECGAESVKHDRETFIFPGQIFNSDPSIVENMENTSKQIIKNMRKGKYFDYSSPKPEECLSGCKKVHKKDTCARGMKMSIARMTNDMWFEKFDHDDGPAMKGFDAMGKLMRRFYSTEFVPDADCSFGCDAPEDAVEGVKKIDPAFLTLQDDSQKLCCEPKRCAAKPL